MAVDLTPFLTAKTILWVRHTVFAPHRGDDGNLVTDEGHSIPLDTWLPQTTFRYDGGEERRVEVKRPPVSGEVAMAVVDPETLDDVHAAIVDWFRDNLGRTYVTFGD